MLQINQKNLKFKFVWLPILVISVFLIRNSFYQSNDDSSQRVLETTLTQKICASKKPYPEYSSDDISRYESILDKIRASRNGNPLVDYIEGKNSNSRFYQLYLVPLATYAIPWVLFFLITFILICLGICNWCCMYGYCKHKYDRSCMLCKPIKTTKRKRKVIIFALSLVFEITTLALAMTGSSYSSTIGVDGDNFYCSVVNFLEQIENGNLTEGWLGLSGATEGLERVLNEYDQILNLQYLSYSFNDLDYTISKVNSSLDDIYNSNQNLELERPNPLLTNTVYRPLYIENLGPYSNQSTYTGAIFSEMNTKMGLMKNALQDSNSSISNLKLGYSVVSDRILEEYKQVANISTKIDDFLKLIDDNGPTLTFAFIALGYILFAIFIISIAFQALGIISTINVWLFKTKNICFKLTNAVWIVLGIMSVISFFWSIILFPTTLLLGDICNGKDLALQNQTFFNVSLRIVGDQTIQDGFYTCQHGTKDYLATLKLRSEFQYIDNIFQYHSKLLNYTNYAGGPNSTAILRQQNYINNVISGKSSDSSSIDTDLTSLNNYVSKTRNTCTQLQDKWVLSNTSCTSDSYVFQNTDPEYTKALASVCIGFNFWMTGNAKSVSNRYNSTVLPTSCNPNNSLSTTEDLFVQNFVERFILNRQYIQNNFTAILSDLSTIKQNYDNFTSQMIALSSQFNTINATLYPLYDPISGSINGLYPNMNCSSISTKFSKMLDSVCIGMLSSLYMTMVYMIVLGFFGWASSTLVWLYTKNVYAKEYDLLKP